MPTPSFFCEPIPHESIPLPWSRTSTFNSFPSRVTTDGGNRDGYRPATTHQAGSQNERLPLVAWTPTTISRRGHAEAETGEYWVTITLEPMRKRQPTTTGLQH